MSTGAGSKDDPETLGERMALGDKEAAGRAFILFDDYLLRSLERKFGLALDSTDRDEVIGKVLARFIKKPSLFAVGTGQLRGYLTLCVLREGKKKVDRVGRLRRSQVLLGSFDGDGWLQSARNECPRRMASQSEELEIVKEMARSLRPKHREVVECYLESGDEYSTVLAVRNSEPKETIQTRLNRAKKELRGLVQNRLKKNAGA